MQVCKKYSIKLPSGYLYEVYTNIIKISCWDVILTLKKSHFLYTDIPKSKGNLKHNLVGSTWIRKSQPALNLKHKESVCTFSTYPDDREVFMSYV